METLEKENPERQRNLCGFLLRHEEEWVNGGHFWASDSLF